MKEKELKELKTKVKVLINKKRDLPYICDFLKISEIEAIGVVELLKRDGELVDYLDGQIIKLDKPIQNKDTYKIPNKLSHIKLLLLSDTHLASKYDRVDILNYIYDKAKKQGITIALHCGDLTDGRSNRAEQVYELKEPSYEGQIKYVVDNYPRIDGITTYFIDGNHDGWWYKSCGSDIGKAISNERKDLVYLGPDVGDLDIGKLKIRMFHGKGGIAYAKSYKVQKYLDSIPIDEKPDILQMGHIHQAFYFKQDFTHVFQTGCLEDQTPFTRSLGLNNEKSCWWVDIDFDKEGNVLSITPTLEEFDKKKQLTSEKVKTLKRK